MKLAIGLFSVSVLATLTFAQSAVAAGGCAQLKSACEAAGYEPDAHKVNGKGLHHDCMKVLLSGGSVPGVTPPAGAVASCQAKKASKGTAVTH